MPYKLNDKAYADFTGEVGQVSFVDGVSVGNPPQVFLDRLAASFGLSDSETGEPAGLIARMSEITAVAFVPPAALDRMSPEQIAAANAAAVSAIAKVMKPSTTYSEAELEAVAEKDGIAGLRAIAGPYGIKGKAIPALIQAILAGQAAVTKAHAPAVIQLSDDAKAKEAAGARAVAIAAADKAAVAAKAKASDAEKLAKEAEDALAAADAAEAALKAGAAPAVQVQG